MGALSTSGQLILKATQRYPNSKIEAGSTNENAAKSIVEQSTTILSTNSGKKQVAEGEQKPANTKEMTKKPSSNEQLGPVSVKKPVPWDPSNEH